MTITRVGTTKKYAEGWAAAFGGKAKQRAGASPAKTRAKKKAAAGASKKKNAGGRAKTARRAR